MQPTFRKTSAGIAELERHTLKLRPELRRLLIMIDGKRAIDSLAPFFRPHELPQLVDELLQCGAIETAVPVASFLLANGNAGNASAAPPANGTRGTLNSGQLTAAVSSAKLICKARFGRGSDRFLAALDKCKDSLELRVIVSDIQLKLMADIGDEAATEFVIALREAVRRA